MTPDATKVNQINGIDAAKNWLIFKGESYEWKLTGSTSHHESEERTLTKQRALAGDRNTREPAFFPMSFRT